MRIGLIVDGQSEFNAMPCISTELGRVTQHVIVKTLFAPIHPKSPIDVIVGSCASRVRILRARYRVDRVIVLFDFEDRQDCPGALAQSVGAALQRRTGIDTMVVIKHRTLENWLIADVEALRSHPGRFAISESQARKIIPNKADKVNAMDFLSKSVMGKHYEKVRDSRTIFSSADVLRIAQNSRSFRRLLRCMGHPAYAAQSRLP